MFSKIWNFFFPAKKPQPKYVPARRTSIQARSIGTRPGQPLNVFTSGRNGRSSYAPAPVAHTESTDNTAEVLATALILNELANDHNFGSYDSSQHSDGSNNWAGDGGSSGGAGASASWTEAPSVSAPSESYSSSYSSSSDYSSSSSSSDYSSSSSYDSGSSSYDSGSSSSWSD